MTIRQNIKSFVGDFKKKKSIKHCKSTLYRLFKVGLLGLEPRKTAPKTVVLPLHHRPICLMRVQIYNKFYFKQVNSEKKLIIYELSRFSITKHCILIYCTKTEKFVNTFSITVKNSFFARLLKAIPI